MVEKIKKATPRDFFLYLFVTIAVFYCSIQVIVLFWQYVDYFFPEPFGFYGGISDAMRWSVASLLVVFPIYVAVMWFLGRDIDNNPWKREMRVRKWLIFITLFAAGVTIIGDLVGLVYTFLGGDLAVRFVLKSLAVLFVAAAVFGYYLFNLRREPGTRVSTRKAVAWGASALVLVIVIGAFFIVGSPETNRLRRFDEQRVGDLQSIQWQVVNYWQQKEKLPVSLAELEDPISGFVTPRDPETDQAYEYLVRNGLTFELCAGFNLKSISRDGYGGRPVPADIFDSSQAWQHDAGRVCFERTIDPERYPVFEKGK